jgi:DNA polymerase-1
MVIPEDGHKLVIGDLSQVELRVVAMISDDQNMIHAFSSGHDFHAYTACVMFDIPLDKFDKSIKEHSEKRSYSKSINFGILYQMQSASLANKLGVTIDKAEAFMKKFFSAYPKVSAWVNYTKAFARQHGYVDNFYGRRRFLPDIYSSTDYIREGAERQAVNTPIQSTAGDICFIGLNRFYNWLLENNMKSKIIGTVHDSILVEAPFDEVALVEETLPLMMTKDIPRINIELKADVEVLDKWIKS